MHRFFLTRPDALLAAVCLLGLASGCSRSSGSSSPERVRLNEVMARNTSVVVPDNVGTGFVHDWVEVHNSGESAVHLGNFSLTDNRNRPEKFVFPVGTRVEAGDFLIVFLVNRENCRADCESDRTECRNDGETLPEDCDAGFDECVANCSPVGLVADFGLSASAPEGESVFLFSSEGRLLDQIGALRPEPDVSNGRFPDSTGSVGLMYLPTPGATNQPVGLRAARVISTGQADGSDLDDTTPVELEILVERDLVLDSAARAAQGELSVEVEYLDLAPGQSCPPPSEELDGQTFISADVRILDVSETTDNDRMDLLGNPISVPVLLLNYGATLPAAPCDVVRYYRVIVDDGLLPEPEVRFGCLVSCGETSLLVNEYQPSNTKLVFQSVNSRGEPRPLSTPDWLELHNVGSQPLTNIGSYLLVGLGDCENGTFDPADDSLNVLRGRENEDGDLAPLPPLEAGGFLLVIADDDGGDGRRTYAFAGDSDGNTFFSTRFRLNPTRRDDPDGFCLLSPAGVLVDRVVLDFLGTGTPIDDDQSAGRFEAEGLRANALQPGTVTDCATPEKPNLLDCEQSPRFEEVVTIQPEGGGRCPDAGVPVVVRGRVNFDLDTSPEHFEVRLVALASGAEIPNVALDVSRSDDQTDAAPAMAVYDLTATVPGLESGTFVEFFFEATDLRLGTPTVRHDELSVPAGNVSFRYLVDFQPPADAPRLNELMPGNSSTLLPAFEGLPAELVRFPDYAEIFNPRDEAVDLDGYFLTDASQPDEPLRRPKEWRFPPGSIVPAGGHLLLYFQSPPDVTPPLTPPDYVYVDEFDLLCERESLFLVAPDDPALGANCVIDSVSWLLASSLGCREDTAVGRGCGDDTSFGMLPAPSPGAPNVLPTQVDGSFHELLLTGERNSCLSATTGPVRLSTIVFVDSGLLSALGASGSLPSATYLVDSGNGEVPGQTQLSAPTEICDAADPTSCVRTPDGYGIVRVAHLLTNIVDGMTYRVLFTDACGEEFEVGPFSLGSEDTPRPPITLNEINRSSIVPGETVSRPWGELANSGTETVDLSGMYLSDDSFQLRKLPLPAGLTVPGGGFAVVFLDEEVESSGPFDLTVGELFLLDTFDRGSCILNRLGFDFSGIDSEASLGRDPAGGDTAILLAAPSPGASNGGEPTFVRGDVNEDLAVTVVDMVLGIDLLTGEAVGGPVCLDARDVNDDGLLNIADMIFLGDALFRSRLPIPPPFPLPGLDPTPDDLGCGTR